MKTVVHDFIIQKNKLGEKITPIYLYSILYDVSSNSWLRFNSSGSNVTFDGVVYERQVVGHNTISENSNGMLDNIKLTVGNAEELIKGYNKRMQYYMDNYDGLKEKKCLITLVWLEAIDESTCFVEHEYNIENGSSNDEFVVLNLGSTVSILDNRIPKRIFSRYRCQVAEFKDEDCGYSGSASSCDRQYETCEGLGNLTRIGLFPGIPMHFQELIK